MEATRRIARAWHNAVWFVSGEWMLTFRSRRPNGGSVIVARSLWSATVLYLAWLGVRELIDPTKSWHFSWDIARRTVHETLPWFGAILAGVYASLYARFSSQWTYLASLYNQIKAAELGAVATGRPGAANLIADWKAAFVEDADDLHLATKPLFASVVKAWLQDPGVRAAFSGYAVGGEVRLLQIQEAAVRYSREWPKELGAQPATPGLTGSSEPRSSADA